MGAVYKATDTRLGHKVVAVKEMSDAAITDPAEKQQARQAFQQEAQMLATLNHPNLPRVTDHFNEAGKQYLVMDFVEGRTLEEVLNQTPGFLDEDQVIEWGVQLCGVLNYLHSQRPPVIFRDLKPENIMVDQDGKVKLIDFGIVRLFKPGKTADTTTFGTAGYAPPEQYGQGQTDARSDVYALGATLHHLLSDRHPGQSPFNFPSVRSLNPNVSRTVEKAIVRAVEQDPGKRWQSVSEMQQALTAPQAAPPPKAAAKPVPTPGLAPVVPPPPLKAAPRPRRPTPAPAPATQSGGGAFLVTVVVVAGVCAGLKVMMPSLWDLFRSDVVRYLFYTLWWVAGPLAYMLTRRRGATFLAAGLDSAISSYFVPYGGFGFMNPWAYVPAVAMECVFAVRSYRRPDYWTVVLAAVCGYAASIGVSYIHWSSLAFSLDQLISAVVGGSFAYGVGRALGK